MVGSAVGETVETVVVGLWEGMIVGSTVAAEGADVGV